MAQSEDSGDGGKDVYGWEGEHMSMMSARSESMEMQGVGLGVGVGVSIGRRSVDSLAGSERTVRAGQGGLDRMAMERPPSRDWREQRERGRA